MNIFSDHRAAQLQREHSIDSALTGMLDECPRVVSELLLWRARVNREQFESVHQAHFIDKYKVIKNNMHANDDTQRDLKNILLGNIYNQNRCKLLESFIVGLSNR